MNTNEEVEWRKFIVPKKVEQIIDHLFIDTYTVSTEINVWSTKFQLAAIYIVGWRL